jgi:hypothetical protein
MDGSIDKAIEHFGTAGKLDPGNPMYRKNLLRAKEMKKDASNKAMSGVRGKGE